MKKLQLLATAASILLAGSLGSIETSWAQNYGGNLNPINNWGPGNNQAQLQPLPGTIATGNYRMQAATVRGSGVTPPVNTLAFLPYYAYPGDPTVKNYNVNFTTAPTGAYSWEVCLYNSNGPGNYPGTLVTGSDSTLVSTGTAIAVVSQNLASPITLAPGLYWLAVGFAGTASGVVSSINGIYTFNFPSIASSFAAISGMNQTSITYGANGTSNCPTTATTSPGTTGAIAAVAVGY